MGKITQDNLVENFGNIYGTCVELVANYGKNTRVYEVKPNIKGNYGLPVRILTTMYLRIGSNYSIRGHLDTIELNFLIVPVLIVTKITEIKKSSMLTTRRSSPSDRAEFASFVYVEDLTVIKVSHQSNESILTLKKEKQDKKYIHILEFVCMSTYPSRRDCEVLKEGDKISFVGTIHRDRKYDNDTKLFEVGVKLLEVNPSKDKIDYLLNSLTVLHSSTNESEVFEDNLNSLLKNK